MKKNLVGKILCCVLALTFMVALVGCGSDDAEGNKTEQSASIIDVAWDSCSFADVIPKPETDTLAVEYRADDDSFYVELEEQSEKDFDNYVKQCIDKGFNVDYKNKTESDKDKRYSAANADGYEIYVKFKVKDGEIRIKLSTPDKN